MWHWSILMIHYGTNENWAYNSRTETVVFTVEEDGQRYPCAVSREAIEDHYGNCANDDEILGKAKEHFEDIIDEIGDKCGKRLFEEDGSILLRTTDW